MMYVTQPTIYIWQSCKLCPYTLGHTASTWQNTLRTFVVLACHTRLCVAMNSGNSFGNRRNRTHTLFLWERAIWGWKKMMNHIHNRVFFHRNTHQEHTVKYKGYTYSLCVYICVCVYKERFLKCLLHNERRLIEKTSHSKLDQRGLIALQIY